MVRQQYDLQGRGRRRGGITASASGPSPSARPARPSC